MKVPTIRTPATAPTQRTQRATQTGGARFADHLKSDGGEEETVKAAAVSGVSAVAALLGAQEVGDDAEKEARRQMAGHGNDILDRLEELRRDILMGAVPRAKLESLAQTLRRRRASVNDPRLLEIIDEIELRAAVELAKLTR